MKNHFVWSGLCLLLCACGGEASKAEEAVLRSLIDPDSAKFGKFSMVSGKQNDHGCLTVNSKNSFGGYTGDQQALLMRPKGTDEWQVRGIVGEFNEETCLDASKTWASGEE